MSDGHDTELHDVHAADAADERFLVRNPRQLRQLLRSLIDQRSLIKASAHGVDAPAWRATGSDPFPTGKGSDPL
ncbi:TPA: hypothetical protein ACGCG9_004352, partial [Stenotrophomonas maltophilia]